MNEADLEIAVGPDGVFNVEIFVYWFSLKRFISYLGDVLVIKKIWNLKLNYLKCNTKNLQENLANFNTLSMSKFELECDDSKTCVKVHQ